MEFIEEWRSVTVELNDSVDDIAPGLILSFITTVTLEPVLLLSDLIDMFPNRKDTLRNSTEMMARYEKDDDIERALTMIDREEYKDDGFFHEDGTFEFAKCFGCGGPKIGHSKRTEKDCSYVEFLKGKKWGEEEIRDMEDRIMKMKGFNDAMMKLDRRAHHRECIMNDCNNRKHDTAYDLKCHLEKEHRCGKEIIKMRFRYKTGEVYEEEDSDDEIWEKSNDPMLKQVLQQSVTTQELIKVMASFMMNSEKEREEKKGKQTTHFVKPRNVPNWSNNMK